jgi:hypothetical protein
MPEVAWERGAYSSSSSDDRQVMGTPTRKNAGEREEAVQNLRRPTRNGTLAIQRKQEKGFGGYQ